MDITLATAEMKNRILSIDSQINSCEVQATDIEATLDKVRKNRADLRTLRAQYVQALTALTALLDADAPA